MKALGIIAGIAVVLFLFVCQPMRINNVPTYQEEVKSRWGQVVLCGL